MTQLKKVTSENEILTRAWFIDINNVCVGTGWTKPLEFEIIIGMLFT